MFTFPIMAHSLQKASRTRFFTAFSQSAIGAPFLSWSNLANLGAFDNVHARTSVGNGSVISETIELKTPTSVFDIPEDATITGIKVTIERHYTGTNTSVSGDIWVNKHGGGGGTKTDNNTWFQNADVLTYEYGGDGDLWGTTWTPADINGANFSVQYRANGSGFVNGTVKVDAISVTIYYEV
jgi:hypothetical protein